MASKTQLARRAFVQVLLALAISYGLVLGITRDSPDEALKAAFRKVIKKAHPDKGGRTDDAKKLHTAKDTWEKAKTSRGAAGRPPATAPPQHDGNSPQTMASPEDFRKARRQEYRIKAQGVMLTYNGMQDQAQWNRLVQFFSVNGQKFRVKHWCATLEMCADGVTLHAHVYLQFHKEMDITTVRFCFEGIAPRADQNDYLGEGINCKRAQESMNRGFFYVWADKIGTVRDAAGNPCVAGNYMPCWTQCKFKYVVRGRWADSLWKAHKLTHDTYEAYLFHTRDGVVTRKRNLDAVREEEKRQRQKVTRDERIERIRGNGQIFKPFPVIPEAVAWLACFLKEAVRYPIMIVHGRSRAGKTEWAKSLFKRPLQVNIGNLQTFPNAMRAFDRDVHDGIVLDDVRDCRFLVDAQDKLQGTYDRVVEFASTQGGQCAYEHDLSAIPIVVTINDSTLNMDLLRTDDWLGNVDNRLVVEYPPAGWNPN